MILLFLLYAFLCLDDTLTGIIEVKDALRAVNEVKRLQ